MPEPSQDIVVSIPAGFTAEQREQIATEIVRFIVSRTRKGLDVNNNTFTPYSQSYKNSLEFKNAGKSNKVNLTLTGEMLNTLELKAHGPGFLRIGFPDTEENDKAAWNTRNNRQFMGISQVDLAKILNGFTNPEENDQLTRSTTSSFLRRIIGG